VMPNCSSCVEFIFQSVSQISGGERRNWELAEGLQ
jgi:hypothetical protein